MQPLQRIRLGAAGGFALAAFSLVVSDLHAIGDLLLTNLAGGPATAFPLGFSAMYRITAFVGWPLVAIAGALLALGFFSIGRQDGRRSSLVAGGAAGVYAVTSVWAASADARYAAALDLLSVSGDWQVLTAAAWHRGLSAMVIGLVGGIVMTASAALMFRSFSRRTGSAGAVLALAAIGAGIAVKFLAGTVYPVPLTAAFLLLMGLKSVGLCLIGTALLQIAGDGVASADLDGN